MRKLHPARSDCIRNPQGVCDHLQKSQSFIKLTTLSLLYFLLPLIMSPTKRASVKMVDWPGNERRPALIAQQHVVTVPVGYWACFIEPGTRGKWFMFSEYRSEEYIHISQNCPATFFCLWVVCWAGVNHKPYFARQGKWELWLEHWLALLLQTNLKWIGLWIWWTIHFRLNPFKSQFSLGGILRGKKSSYYRGLLSAVFG